MLYPSPKPTPNKTLPKKRTTNTKRALIINKYTISDYHWEVGMPARKRGKPKQLPFFFNNRMINR